MNVFAIRHGETAWGLSGGHTGTSGIPLTQNGALGYEIPPNRAGDAAAER